MECQFCHCDVSGLAKVSTYGEGIWVCEDCRKLIYEHRYQPYSQVMEKVAMLEAGYHVNRKLATINRGTAKARKY
jgi:ribosomal protein L37AE/L43A